MQKLLPSHKPAHSSHMPEVSAEWAAAASNLLSNIRSSWTNCAVLTAASLPGTREDREKIWDPSTMFSEDLWLENEKSCAVVHKSKRGRKRQELLAVALGVKVGVKGALLWQPLKLFAYSQITSLVRRAALTQNDNHFNYEKAHNFKVSMTSYYFRLKSSVSMPCVLFFAATVDLQAPICTSSENNLEKKIVSTLSSTDCIPNMSLHKYLIQIMFLLLARLLNWYFSSFCPDSVLFCCCSEKKKVLHINCLHLKVYPFLNDKKAAFQNPTIIRSH